MRLLRGDEHEGVAWMGGNGDGMAGVIGVKS